MERKLMYFVLFVFITISNFSKADTITAVNGPGNEIWHIDATWDLGRVPECGDVIIIPAGVTVQIPAAGVSLTSGLNCGSTHIIVHGKIDISNGTQFNLAEGTCIEFTSTGTLDAVGGGKGTGRLNIGETTEWQTTDGDVNGAIGFGCASLLPVELISFNLEIINNAVELSFETASERELDYFVIEVSRNGSYWQEVATVKATGNSASNNSYSATDKNPFNGVSYYRLKDVSFDGAVNVLEIITCEYTSTKYLVYPIPVNKLMFLEGEKLSTSEVYVVNSVGEKVEVEMYPMGDKLSFNFENIKSGIYFLKIQSENTKRTERISVVHK